MPDFVVPEDRAGRVVPNLPSGHENDTAGAVLEGEKRVLLHHENGYSARGELTEAERRVATLVAEGHSNREVAEALFVTVRTVEANLTRAYAKLVVRSRTELASRWREDQR